MTDATGELEDLRAVYLEEALQKLDSMTRSLDALEREPGDAAALEELRRRFHGFTGSGSTYGFPRLTALGAEGEAACEAGAASAAEPCRRLVADLRAELIAARPGRLEADIEAPRVLWLEGDPRQGALIGTVLSSAGYDAMGCGEPSDFEAVLLSFRPHLVLVDAELRGASGHDVVRRLRQQGHAALPVILLCTGADAGARAAAEEAGADGWLAKPVAPRLLLAAVAARVERAGPPRG